MNCEQNTPRHIGMLQIAATRYLGELLDAAGTGITVEQYRFLTYLWKADGVMQQQLAGQQCRDKAGVARMVDILENQGIITRIPDKNDRRVNLIYLTKKGRELEATAESCAQQCIEKMLTNFSEEEISLFHTLLLRATHNLQG